jgi:hypothetical protein
MKFLDLIIHAMRRAMLLVPNALIWCVNAARYLSHLEGQRHCATYTPYDFAREIKPIR